MERKDGRKPVDLRSAEEITVENCGAKLTEICEASGMSLKELASVLGVKQATLSHIKNANRVPTTDFMNRLLAIAMIKLTITASDGIEGTRLTVESVVRGLAAFARTNWLGTRSTIIGGIVGSVAGASLTYGAIIALRKICSEHNLSCEEVDDRLDIKKDHEPP